MEKVQEVCSTDVGVGSTRVSANDSNAMDYGLTAMTLILWNMD